MDVGVYRTKLGCTVLSAASWIVSYRPNVRVWVLCASQCSGLCHLKYIQGASMLRGLLLSLLRALSSWNCRSRTSDVSRGSGRLTDVTTPFGCHDGLDVTTSQGVTTSHAFVCHVCHECHMSRMSRVSRLSPVSHVSRVYHVSRASRASRASDASRASRVSRVSRA